MISIRTFVIAVVTVHLLCFCVLARYEYLADKRYTRDGINYEWARHDPITLGRFFGWSDGEPNYVRLRNVLGPIPRAYDERNNSQ